MSRRARRSVLLIGAALVAWYLCVVLLWAVRPLSDSLPLGIDWSLKVPKQVSQTVDCNSLFDARARDNSPLPALNRQPPGKAPLVYPRAACTQVQREARIVLALDTLFLPLGLGGLVLVGRRLSAEPPVPELPRVAPALVPV